MNGGQGQADRVLLAAFESDDLKTYYMDRITSVISQQLKGSAVTLSQLRVDRFTLARELTAKVHDDRKNYRVLILPDNAVVTINGRNADDVFGGEL